MAPASGGSALDPAAGVWYEVVFGKVLVKKRPSEAAPSWGWVTRGRRLQAKPAVVTDAKGRAWAELTFLELLRSCAADEPLDSGFCLIDGSSLGLGRLLRGPLPFGECLELEAEIAALAARLQEGIAANASPEAAEDSQEAPAAVPWEQAPPEPVRRRIGEGLWRAGPLLAAPDCSFFPREGYVVQALTGGSQVYLLGGQRDGRFFNDVWLLRLSASGGTWMEVSKPSSAERPEEGASTALASKWSGRERFGFGVGTVKPGRMALYVVGGRTGHGYPEDVWASDDSGAGWYCMSQKAPFGCRLDPGLALVPGRYEQVLLCGGWTGSSGDRCLVGDVWASSDAGMTWQQLKSPEAWQPRGAPLMAFPPGAGARGGRRLLVLGGTGCPMGGAGMSERMLSNAGMNERTLSDAWEAELDILAGELEWRPLGEHLGHASAVNADSGAADLAGTAGFCARTAAWDQAAAPMPPRAADAKRSSWREAGAITSCRDGHFLVAPPPAPQPWAPAELREKSGEELMLPEQVVHGFQSLALVSAPRVACPRLFVFTRTAAFASTTHELRWQRRFLEQVGRALDASGRMPLELWEDRVAVALLMPKARKPTPAPAGRPK